MVAITQRERIWGAEEVSVYHRQPRRDALPENTNYVDSGCDLHKSCLTCPLETCRYDKPGGVRRLLSDERDSRILRLQREQRLTINDIARRCGVSRRTVFRVMARAKQGGQEKL